MVVKQNVNKIEEISIRNGKIVELGIQSYEGNKFEITMKDKLDAQEIEIGKTGYYEARDVEITSIKRKEGGVFDNNTFIEYTLKK